MRAGVGHGIRTTRLVCFWGALLALVIAIVSPLDALSGVLFSAHMGQHLLLVLVAAPLLVQSDLPLALIWALPRDSAQKLGRVIHQNGALRRGFGMMTNPIAVWLLFALALWGWHAPFLYQAAFRDETIHTLEHLSFLLTAVLFWSVLLQQTAPKFARYGMAVAFLFTASLQCAALGSTHDLYDAALVPVIYGARHSVGTHAFARPAAGGTGHVVARRSGFYAFDDWLFCRVVSRWNIGQRLNHSLVGQVIDTFEK